MATGYNCPQTFVKAFDNDGNPAPGAKLYAFLAGSTIPKKLYYDYALTQPCPHPLVADSDGNFAQYFLEYGAYKLSLFDQDDNQLRPPEEPIWGTGGSGSGGDVEPSVSEIPNFSEKDIQWCRDDAGDLWNGETPLGFRSDFDVNGMNWLHFFKSKFFAALGISTGRFAVYGEESALLYDSALPDGDYYGIEEFAVPIDISSYRYLAICMDPGVSAAEQPITQTMTRWPLPIASSFGPGNRWVSAHMVEHTHNSAWPETAPGLPVVPTVDPVGSIKYCIARWCAIGVSA